MLKMGTVIHSCIYALSHEICIKNNCIIVGYLYCYIHNGYHTFPPLLSVPGKEY